MEGCIICGSNSSEDGCDDSPTGSYDLDYCAIVLAGPNSLMASPGYTATQITETNCVYDDPYFVQTTNPFAADYFDVQNDDWAAAGPGGTPLSGGGDWIGGVPVELSILTAD